MKNIVFIMFALGLMSMTACTNTVSGVGKDMEKAGESIKKSVKRLEQKFEDKEAEE